MSNDLFGFIVQNDSKDTQKRAREHKLRHASRLTRRFLLHLFIFHKLSVDGNIQNSSCLYCHSSGSSVSVTQCLNRFSIAINNYLVMAVIAYEQLFNIIVVYLRYKMREREREKRGLKRPNGTHKMYAIYCVVCVLVFVQTQN